MSVGIPRGMWRYYDDLILFLHSSVSALSAIHLVRLEAFCI